MDAGRLADVAMEAWVDDIAGPQGDRVKARAAILDVIYSPPLPSKGTKRIPQRRAMTPEQAKAKLAEAAAQGGDG